MKHLFYRSLFVAFLWITGCSRDLNEVAAPQNPACSFKGLTDGEEILRGVSKVLTVEATDQDGTIKTVKLYLDDQFLGTAAEAATSGQFVLSCDFKGITLGSHKLKAVCTDNDELAGTIETNVKLLNKAPEILSGGTQNKSYYLGADSVMAEPVIIRDLNTTDTITAVLQSSNISAGSLTAWSGATYDNGVWHVRGLQTQVNQALSRLSFKPATSATATSETVFTLKVKDEGGMDSVGGELRFTSVYRPEITLSTGSISYQTVTVGTAVEKNFTISGSNLAGSIGLVASGGFLISRTSGSNFSANLELQAVNGGLNSQIYVRFAPSETREYNGTIICTATGALSKEIILSGTGGAAAVPRILTTVDSLPDFGSVTVNNSSGVKNLGVTGENLSVDISVTVPAGFEVTVAKNAKRSKNLRNVTLPPGGGVLQVKFKPTETINYSGYITLVSGTVIKKVKVCGQGTALPTFTVSGQIIDSKKKTGIPGVVLIGLTGSPVTDASGNYSTQVSHGWSGTVTPYKAGYSFNPLSRAYNNVTNNQSTQNYTGSNAPAITVSPNNLSFGNVYVGQISVEKNFAVSGFNLIGDLVVNPPDGYEISLSSSSDFSSSDIIISPNSGVVQMTTIYVRFKPDTNQYYNGNISCISNGVESKNVSVTGSGIMTVINVNPASLHFGEVPVNAYSPPLNFSLSAIYLQDDITITAPGSFEVSRSLESNFTNSIYVSKSELEADSQTIYVRFRPFAPISYSGVITCGSSGAVTKNVVVLGIGKSFKSKNK